MKLTETEVRAPDIAEAFKQRYYFLTTFSKYSETCIKRTPSIKRTVAEVPKFISLIYLK